jgi:pyruvate/2-oxoglutarate dehydrogenase complex dihydrolipoamide dehydrogenase (E3) component
MAGDAARFGSKVTIVDRNDRLLHREDDDVTDGPRSLFEDEGVNLVLNSEVQRVSGTSGQSVRISLLQDGVERTLEGSHLLVAAERIPNTKDLGWNSQAWK